LHSRAAAAAAVTGAAALLVAACGGDSGSDSGGSVGGPSGAITLTGCVIASGASSCPGSVVWTSTGAASPQISAGGTILSTASSGSAPLTISVDPTTVTRRSCAARPFRSTPCGCMASTIPSIQSRTAAAISMRSRLQAVRGLTGSTLVRAARTDISSSMTPLSGPPTSTPIFGSTSDARPPSIDVVAPSVICALTRPRMGVLVSRPTVLTSNNQTRGLP
jgi:hypothetical protein